jgi:hypothetical protein
MVIQSDLSRPAAQSFLCLPVINHVNCARPRRFPVIHGIALSRLTLSRSLGPVMVLAPALALVRVSHMSAALRGRLL